MGRMEMGIGKILLLFVEYSIPMYKTNDVAFIDSATLSPCPSDNTVRLLRVTSTGHEHICKLFIGPYAKSTPLLTNDRSSVSSNQLAL